MNPSPVRTPPYDMRRRYVRFPRLWLAVEVDCKQSPSFSRQGPFTSYTCYSHTLGTLGFHTVLQSTEYTVILL